MEPKHQPRRWSEVPGERGLHDTADPFYDDHPSENRPDHEIESRPDLRGVDLLLGTRR